MKKKLLLYIIILSSFIGFSQIPTGYYSTATGSGYQLKTQLNTIITNGHIDNGYSALYNAYIKTDTDSFYENDNSVLDMYSENPVNSATNNDAYNYDHNTRNCGNYNSENDCYNREHIFPQGFFNKQVPMRTDIHHVVPSDGYVNGRRSNYPFGEVTSATYTSNNGSKVGSNTFHNYSGIVFEPINEFKGDIARMLLYFATRYENDVTSSSWDSHTVANNPLNGTNNQVYEDWYIRLLNKWHTNDPVSQREIVRNNEAYLFQGNRNPFIDHPEYVANIWGAVLSTNNDYLANTLKIYPNPVKGNDLFVKTTKECNVKVYNVIGKLLLSKNVNTTNPKIDISSLNKGIYLVKIISDYQFITKKLIKK